MSQFAIDARSCTLLTSDNKLGLLDGSSFVIPIYQRPYSWGEAEVRRLFKGIISSYQNQREPSFLGTAQLMPRAGQALHYDVIDGQQRLTTLALFFKVLALTFPAVTVPPELLSGQWLKTNVNKGEQQHWFDAALTLTEWPADAGQDPNPYITNAAHIRETLRAAEQAEEGRPPFVVSQDFLSYVLHSLHVVVIETRAGLAKTLDIFNTINTAGMDLNGGDVFKIQLYEYLARRSDSNDPAASDRIFGDIDTLYGRINASKFPNGRLITNIGEILTVYKYILIERAAGNRALHGLSTDRFFEQLFAYLLLGEKRPEFARLQEALGNAPLKDLNYVLDARCAWENEFKGSYHLWYTLQWYTRYEEFWLIDVVYLYRFAQRPEYCVAQFHEWKTLLVRFFIIQSLRYFKKVYAARNFVFDVIRQLLTVEATQESANAMLRQQIANEQPRWLRDQLEHETIYHNAKRSQLIVRLGALLEYNDWNEPDLRKHIFEGEFDVEHIRPCNPDVPSPDDEAWEEQQHKLGNLILLERWLNRSGDVSNYDFHFKSTNGYPQSKIRIVDRLLTETAEADTAALRTWTPAKAKARTSSEVERLIRFLYADCAPAHELDALWTEKQETTAIE